MNIRQFGPGDWWPRPDQAAAGALDHLPPGQWPGLASKWRAAGFDLEPLRGSPSFKLANPRLATERIVAVHLAGVATGLSLLG